LTSAISVENVLRTMLYKRLWNDKLKAYNSNDFSDFLEYTINKSLIKNLGRTKDQQLKLRNEYKMAD